MSASVAHRRRLSVLLQADRANIDDAPSDAVTSALLDSWTRSADHGFDLSQLIPARDTAEPENIDLIAAARDEIDEFGGREIASLFIDRHAAIRVRSRGDGPLDRQLDELGLFPGRRMSENEVGTTAGVLSLQTGERVFLPGPLHFHPDLASFAESAAPVTVGGEVAGAVVILSALPAHPSLALELARRLSADIARRYQGAQDAAFTALRAEFLRRVPESRWVLATNGADMLTSRAARTLSAVELRALEDEAGAALTLGSFSARTLELPSGLGVDVTTTPVELEGDTVGVVLTMSPVPASADVELDAPSRRQGAHVVVAGRRDFTQTSGNAAHSPDQRRERSRELLSPFDRARRDVAADVSRGRNHLLLGEKGVGKKTLILEQYRRAHPTGVVTVIDPRRDGARHQAQIESAGDAPERPHLLLLPGLSEISSAEARRLDDLLSQVTRTAGDTLVVGCIDDADADPSRAYGLLMRHFHDTVRVPTLRSRVEEIGALALAILRRSPGGRSVRLSNQVIRVLEGYAWPGNVSELQDVLRHAVARKPVGELQPPDLPAVCFTGTAHRLTPLEAAQCDAIIQALYESRGNRYKAAETLGIGRSSLYRKIDAFGISYIA